MRYVDCIPHVVIDKLIHNNFVYRKITTLFVSGPVSPLLVIRLNQFKAILTFMENTFFTRLVGKGKPNGRSSLSH